MGGNRGIKYIVIFLSGAVLLLFGAPLYAANPPGPKGGPGAGPKPGKAKVDTKWENAADRNNDGVVGKVEAKQWKNRHRVKDGVGDTMVSGESPGQGVAEKAEVNTAWERAADTNNDGIVDNVEIEQWRNRPRGGGRSGVGPGYGADPGQNIEDKAKVDTKWENAADRNNDGVVGKVEAKQWKGSHRGGNPPGPAGR
ncbi:MAG: hypothetical protein WC515_06105 [Candidatus Omnitrophota bacterium]